jgi:hypothetical protein
MVGTLIDYLARSVDILDFGDREDGRLALRLTLPNSAGVQDGGGDQADAR